MPFKTYIYIVLISICILSAFNKESSAEQADLVTNGIHTYTLTNKNGASMKVSNYGGAVMSLRVPDRNGNMDDIVLGYDDAKDYMENGPYIGILVGRYANRIGKGKATIDGVEYNFPINNDGNTLHGGIEGFHKKIWNAEEINVDGNKKLLLKYLSKDGEEGFPGNLAVEVLYSLTDANEFKVEYKATTDKTTIINLTQHSYFNLAGHKSGNVLGHELTINADSFTPNDKASLPTGEILSVKDTPLDFLQPHKIGERIGSDYEQLKFGNGYDHNFVLNKQGSELSLAAKVYEEKTGREMEVWTTKPGVQLYTGNYLNNVKGKDGAVYNKNDGFCIEAQYFPDSPNKLGFSNAVLKPGEVYNQTTVYKFNVR